MSSPETNKRKNCQRELHTVAKRPQPPTPPTPPYSPLSFSFSLSPSLLKMPAESSMTERAGIKRKRTGQGHGEEELKLVWVGGWVGGLQGGFAHDRQIAKIQESLTSQSNHSSHCYCRLLEALVSTSQDMIG